MNKLTFLLFILVILISENKSFAEKLVVPKPAPRDTCPVCGMIVSKYPAWTATVVFKDGHKHFFDGAKDMFKFIFSLNKYSPKHQLSDIQTIAVTEYYNLATINAKTAWFVIGSDVYGPMGNELIPLDTEEDARDFMKDHKGKKILKFEEVTTEIINKLDGTAIN